MNRLMALSLSMAVACTTDPPAEVGSPLDGPVVAEWDGHRPVPSFVLDAPTDVFLGEPLTATVSGTLGEGELVYLMLGKGGVGPGPCLAAAGGLCLDVVNPLLIGSGEVDDTGTATIGFTIPPTVCPGLSLGFQGLVVRGFGGAVSSLTNTVLGTTVPTIKGCTDPTALNYDPLATLDDDSCEYDITETVMSWVDVGTSACDGMVWQTFADIAAAMPSDPVTVTIEANQVDPMPDYGHWTATFPSQTCVKTWLDVLAAQDVSTYDHWVPAVCTATDDTGVSYYFVAKNDGGGDQQIAIYPTTSGIAEDMKLYMLDRTFPWCDLAGVNNRPGFDIEVTNNSTYGTAGDSITFTWL